jgi:hypothetical protein
LDIRDLTQASDSVAIGDGTNTVAVDGSGNLAVDIAAQTLTAVSVSANASANSALNPIYVNTVNTTSATEIQDYDVATSVAAAATANHDYVITSSKTFILTQVIFASSGAMKAEVQIGVPGSGTTKAVGFTSMAAPTYTLNFGPGIEQAGTGTEGIRVIKTNRSILAQDLYSTIIGSEV